jgi:hypothetical protein
MDHVNMLFYIRKGDIQTKNAEQYTVMRKYTNFSQLTDTSNIYNVILAVASVEIGSGLPDKIEFTENAEIDNNRMGKVFGIVYSKPTSNVFYLELAFCKDIEAAQELFTKRLDGYENVNKKSIFIFEFGTLLKTEDNDKYIYSKRRLIVVEESQSPNIIVKEGIDALEEFNRKMYSCELNEEDM